MKYFAVCSLQHVYTCSLSDKIYNNWKVSCKHFIWSKLHWTNISAEATILGIVGLRQIYSGIFLRFVGSIIVLSERIPNKCNFSNCGVYILLLVYMCDVRMIAFILGSVEVTLVISRGRQPSSLELIDCAMLH